MGAIDDPRVQPAFEAMLLGDAAALESAIVADPGIVAIPWGENTLLEWTTQPPHEVGDDIVDVLIARGSPLDRALNLAGCWNLAGLCVRLLAAGADPSARADAGITPLESAAMHGSSRAADVLVRAGLYRPSLWLAAASGLVDEVRSWVGSGPTLTRAPGEWRPDWADVGRPAGSAPTDDVSEIVGEAFVFAAANGRLDVADHLLSSGVSIDVRPYRNTTALHFAIQFRQVEAVRFLLGRGASTSIADDEHGGTATGWAQACAGDDVASRQILDLVEAG